MGSANMSIDESIQPIRLLLLLLILLTGILVANGADQKNFYIVYLGDPPAPTLRQSTVQTHFNLLSTLEGSLVADKNSIVHSYINNFNAFAAKLSPDQAKQLSSREDVLSVFPNRYHKLHTTKSWDFIGFPQTVKRNLKMESDIIVGLLDTGISPDAESFNDKGLGPPPAKWKGKCARFANFSGCNNKLIGARYYKLDGNPDPEDILSPVDVEGHGSHTSSTVAGRLVNNASLYGLAKGTARGGVPSARIAMYKVCWVSEGCSDMDILAGFDAAITDGVDLISISIGGSASEYVSDAIAIGSFHAMKRGILTVGSGGNNGPGSFTVANHAPWILTVAASGINRDFRSTIILGNGKRFSGIGIDTFSPTRRSYPLVSGADVALNSSSNVDDARSCMSHSMDPNKVKGKIVYCELILWGADSVVKSLGGTGVILESSSFPDTAQIFMSPGTMVNYTIGEEIAKYIKSTRSPSAVVLRTEEVTIPAPFIASFSSRGPNPGSKHVLKPDIAAPGIDILAAYTPLITLTGLKGDTQHSKFTIMSGTSMACPHVAGVAAYVKSFHPSWSPASIKSAILTTATPMSRRVEIDAEFAYGTGQVNPARALNPGLVYDMDEMNYIQFLCREGYSGSSLGVVVGAKAINCSRVPQPRGEDALNYPTMQLTLKSPKMAAVGVFRRRVTNVGAPKSVYNATIKAPHGVQITVKPATLVFSHVGQKLSFKVVVRANPMASTEMLSASLVWKSFHHSVRSPIVIYSP